MSTTIYYLSGTGNSLAISKEINDILTEKGEIISIPLVIKQEIKAQADTIGFVFPVYYHDAPNIVKEFIHNIEIAFSPYIFAIATCNAEPGRSLYTIDKLLRKKSYELSLGVAIDMPGNAVITEIDVEQKRLLDSKSRVSEITDCIQKRKKIVLDGSNSIKEHIHSTVMSFAGKHIEFSPRRYKSTDSCSGCGICKKVCPVHNISMVQNKPVWKTNCINCVACFHWCPKEAIYMNNTVIKNRRKYHHPDIMISEMFNVSNFNTP